MCACSTLSLPLPASRLLLAAEGDGGGRFTPEERTWPLLQVEICSSPGIKEEKGDNE